MKPYPNEELDRMSKREIIRLYKRTVEQFSDAVPVVRCKDCKHYGVSYFVKCPVRNVRSPDDFCSWAERKEE